MNTEKSGVLGDIAAHIPDQRILRDPDVVSLLSHGEAGRAPIGVPLAAVRAESSAEVQKIVHACHRNGVHFIVRGATTGFSAGATAVDGCVVIALDRLNRIVEIDPVERLAVVQPGIVNDDLRAAVAAHDLWCPPHPAVSPWSTTGGALATHAGGVCCEKYGATRDHVLGLEMVTVTGELVRLGGRTAKDVEGYDLVGMLMGSETMLGVVTEVTLRLRPRPMPAITVTGYFSSIVDAGRAVRAAVAARLAPDTFELVDRHCLRAVDAWKKMGLSADADVILLARLNEPGAAGQLAAERMLACFEEVGATWAACSTDEVEAEALLAAMRLAYPALERLGLILTEDVSVPIVQVPKMLERIERTAERHRITIANIAHAGDGALHPLLITDPGDEAARARAQAALDDISADALALGGTVVGEHTVGRFEDRLPA